ncbi:MAG: redox-regulated ATPase YchF [Parcubacteria group bacterium CG_4_9_14_0_2_um_filter_35_11]|nr:MAG: redox-regulated ATPase YchF [Parcubacteria group bacterium CG07_land_8_20_14_0_80_35_11]PJC47889.1 MAG: redox-regulated ATPase YchF [Parcubacteria group bacterium CG_4_9_14_0_2_um_filter_35_11]
MFSVGIIGLPNIGKSTLFKAVTKIAVPISIFPFTTIDPNKGIVEVKDKRLEKIKEIVKPQKTTPAIIEFVDIAGLVREAHLGKGLGNKFLSHISEVDLLLEVVRLFKNEKVSHVENVIDAERDIEIIKNEIAAWDEKIISNFIENLKKKIKSSPLDEELKTENELAEQLKKFLGEKTWLLERIKQLPGETQVDMKNLGRKSAVLSVKPLIFLFNISERDLTKEEEAKLRTSFPYSFFIDLKKEEEISELSNKEKEELEVSSYLDDLILSCYNRLDLITFYTIKGGREIRAYELKRGEEIIVAAGKVHSDFQKKFIRVEVLSFKDLIESDSWQEAKKRGKINVKGRDYIVNDGDIIEFKI